MRVSAHQGPYSSCILGAVRPAVKKSAASAVSLDGFSSGFSSRDQVGCWRSLPGAKNREKKKGKRASVGLLSRDSYDEHATMDSTL